MMNEDKVKQEYLKLRDTLLQEFPGEWSGYWEDIVITNKFNREVKIKGDKNKFIKNCYF